MAGGAEPEPTGGNEQTKIEQETRDEINQARQQGKSDQQIANQLLDELRRASDSAERAKEAAENNPLARNVVPQDALSLAKEAKKSVIKVLTAVQEGVISVPTNTKKVLNEIARTGINETKASFIHSFVSDYVDGGKEIQFSPAGSTDKTQFEKDFEQLKATNPQGAEILSKAIIEAARKGELPGLTEKVAKEKFETTSLKQEHHRRSFQNLDDEFDYDWKQTLGTFDFSESDREMIRAMYSKEDFARHIGKIKQELGGGVDDYKINKEIERRIIMIFSKLYSKADTERVSKFFDEIVQEGFFNSISMAQILLSRRLYNLRNQFENVSEENLPEELRSIKYYTRRTFRESIDKKVEGKFEVVDPQTGKKVVDPQTGKNKMEETTVPEVKTLPVGTSKPVSLAKFLMDIETEVGHEIEARKFFHNISALVQRTPADPQKGFWSQIAQYADELQSTDIDNLNLLIDADLIETAFALYTKNIQEAFGNNNWIHDPNIFQSMDRGYFNRLQQSTLDQLHEAFPEMDYWRLYRIMKLGIGMAQGVYITEQENAAWADPQIPQKGSITFRSYYYNDSSALNALSPLHTLLRFHTQSNITGPILYSLVSGVEQKPFGIWDHRKLWIKLQQAQDAFVSGTRTFDRKHPDERTLMEVLPNIGRVGSMITRSGWSLRPALEGWYVYEKDTETGLETEDINYLETFQSLQYIGFEAVYSFFGKVLDKEKDAGFKKMVDSGVSKDQKLINDRDNFFKYLYRKYVNPNSTNSNTDYQNEIGQLRQEARQAVEELLRRKGKETIKSRRLDTQNKNYKAELIEEELYKRLMYRALAGMAKDRLPTKFALFDRKRTSADGRSSWEKLRTVCGWDDRGGRLKMDQAVKDIQLVEAMLRRATTERMNSHLRNKNITETTPYSEVTFKDFEVDDRNYVVNEELITEYIKDPSRRDNAVKLLREIKQQYTEKREFMYSFGELFREFDALGNFRDPYFPFSFAPEELEKSFLAFKNSGDKVLKRRMTDTNDADIIVFKNISNLLQMLNPIAISPERKMDELIKAIGSIQHQVEISINKETSYKVAYQLSTMVINYYKKDTVGRNLLTKYFSNDYHSLAARFAGQNKGVWEWEAREIDQFIIGLEQLRILPTEPYDMVAVKYKEIPVIKLFGKTFYKRIGVDPDQIVETPFKIFGITLGKIRQIKGDFEYYGAKLRREQGAAGINIAFEVINRYLPIFLIFVLYEFLKKALEKKKQ